MSLNSSNTTEQLLRHWHYETYWSYGAQLSSCVDRERYQELVKAFSKKYFGDTNLVCIPVCFAYAFVCTRMCVCMCVLMCSVCVYVYVCVYVCVYVHMYVCMYMCVCVKKNL